jgi:hypothetical protein
MKRMLTSSRMIKSMTMVGVFLAAIGLIFAAEPSFNYTMPEGWKVETPAGTVAAAVSPDTNVKIVIYEFPNKENITALQICEKQVAKKKSARVVNPPRDMSDMKDRFGADSVARMQLVLKNPNGAEVSYRAYVFVKKGTFVVVEAYATKEATDEVFKQANVVIENFKFK